MTLIDRLVCTEHYGLDTLISEDFQHGRLYGSVRVENPFSSLG